MPAAVVDTFTAVDTATGKTLVLTVPRAVPASSTIAIALLREDNAGAAGGVASIADSAGNSWVRHDAFSLRSGTCEVTWHHAHITNGLEIGDQITITWNANRIRKIAIAHVITGLQKTGRDATSGAVVTSNPTNSGPNGTSSTPSGSTGATTRAEGLLLAAFGCGTAGGAFTPGAGFTLGASVATAAGSHDRRLATEHRTLSTTGAKTANGTLAASATWAGAAVAFAAVTASNTPPVANAGDDQTVEPWSQVPVGGADTDAEGSIVSIAWTQLSGPAVELASTDTATTSFEAPPGAEQADVVLRKTVTDANGATDTDDVTVLVLPATEFVLVDGVLVPIQILPTPPGEPIDPGVYAATYPATY